MPTHPEAIAWAAGLFEGEGSITVCSGRVRLQLQSTDHEVLSNFAEIIGFGKIYGPYSHDYGDGYTRKPKWLWVCEGSIVPVIFRTLSPWLGTRRRGRARELGIHSM